MKTTSLKAFEKLKSGGLCFFVKTS